MHKFRSKRFAIGTALGALVVVLGIGQAMLDNTATAQQRTVQAPTFEVDPLWPKPLPNHWLLGMTIGVWVDEQDKDRKSTRLNSSHSQQSRMPSSA